jgi:transposase
MENFVVLASTIVGGEVWMEIETVTSTVACSGCGTRAVGHGRSRVWLRDLPSLGRPVRLRWAKRRWRCRDADCESVTWTERSEHVEGSLTSRDRGEMCRRVGKEGHTVAGVALDFGVTWHTVMAAVVDHGAPLVDAIAEVPVATLGLDETAFLGASATANTTYVTGFVGVTAGRLLDVAQGRSATTVSSWLAGHDESWLDAVETVTIDPHAGYKAGLVGRLDHATVVVDPFHAVKLANKVIDDVRRRVQNDVLGHRGRKDDPLYRIRRILLKGAERNRTRHFAHRDADPRLCRQPCSRGSARGSHDQALESRDPQQLGHQRVQRTDRGRQSARQEDQAFRPRLPQLRELSPTAVAPLRGPMEHCTDTANARPSTTP